MANEGMGAEVFRFVSLRPPKRDRGATDEPYIVDSQVEESAIYKALAPERTKSERERAAIEYADSPLFVGGYKQLPALATAYKELLGMRRNELVSSSILPLDALMKTLSVEGAQPRAEGPSGVERRLWDSLYVIAAFPVATRPVGVS